MNVVFVAGGLGTRFNELSVFPKLLLPTSSHDSMLNETISKFNKDNNFYIVINNKYFDMLNNYIKVNYTKDQLGINRLEIVGTSVANGSLSTLADVDKSLPSEDVLFVWSDIILPDINSFNIQEVIEIVNSVGHKNYQGIVFTSRDGKYRYNFDEFEIKEVANYNGNIPGVYYFKNKPDFNMAYSLLSGKNNCDLVDFIDFDITNNKSIYCKADIPNIVEYKDIETYKELLKKHEVNLAQTRFFNNIVIDKDKKTVTKSAINPDYYHIIEDEAKWYSNIIDEIGDGVITPKIHMAEYSKNSCYIVMEYLEDYIPLHTFNDNASIDDMIKAYEGIDKNIKLLSQHTHKVSKDIFVKDLEKEMKTKVLERCDKIDSMLINYNRSELEIILDKVLNSILSLYKDDEEIEYTLCHGDLNGSNVMVNIKNPSDVRFIDPRGYFGFTKKYGWDIYEYSKLLYGLMGYDDFNLNPQLYLTDEPKNHKHIDAIDYLNNPIYKLVVGVIYVALAGYISQDIMKANIAYEYGLKLINDYYGESKNV